MSDINRSLNRLIIAVVAAIVISVSLSSTAVAQQSAEPAWQLPLDVPQRVLSPNSILGGPTTLGQQYSTGPAEDYWIVDLRSSAQHYPDQAQGCCMQFLRSSPDRCLHRSSHGELLAMLEPGMPICVMIHGSYMEWKDVPIDSRNTFRWIRRAAPHLPLRFVYVTWPSDPKLPPLDISILGRQSARNGFYVANFIRSISRDHPICLIGHSHGARMVLSTLHLLNGGQVQGECLPPTCWPPHRYRVVLAAAAVDHDWLNPGRRYGNALPIVECLVNLRTRRDHVLAFYPMRKPFSRSSLGRKGFTKRDFRALGACASRVSELDVTSMVGSHHFWQFYSKHPSLAAALVPVVYFPGTSIDRSAPPPAP